MSKPVGKRTETCNHVALLVGSVEAYNDHYITVSGVYASYKALTQEQKDKDANRKWHHKRPSNLHRLQKIGSLVSLQRKSSLVLNTT